MESLQIQSRNRRIYVGNLSRNIRASDLYEHFAKCGKILKIFYKQPPYAFVEFENHASAEIAIETLNMSNLKKRKILVKKFQRKSHKKNLRDDGEIDAGASASKQEVDMKKFFTSEYDYCGQSSLFNETKSANKSCIITIQKQSVLPYANSLKNELVKVGIPCEIDYSDLNSTRDVIIAQLHNDGYQFSIYINEINVEYKSFSFVSLIGSHIEHRNIPLDEGIKYICKLYNKNLYDQSESNIPKNIKEFISAFLQNGSLTVTQYDLLLLYLSSRRNEQMKFEVGEDDNPASKVPKNPKFNELFQRVYETLTKAFEKLEAVGYDKEEEKKGIASDQNDKLEELIKKVVDDEIIKQKLKEVC